MTKQHAIAAGYQRPSPALPGSRGSALALAHTATPVLLPLLCLLSLLSPRTVAAEPIAAGAAVSATPTPVYRTGGSRQRLFDLVSEARADTAEPFLARMPGHADTATTLSLAALTSFADVATSSPLANLSLRQCIDLAMENNLTLLNQKRDLEISESSLRSSAARFVPFVELISEASYSETRADSLESDGSGGLQRTRTRLTQNSQGGRAQVTQNLPTGGSIVAGAGPSRTRGADGSGPGGGNVTYENDASIRANQPLLRGGGLDVGLADLRSARLSRVSETLDAELRRRDVSLQVIEQYFSLLQAAQDLQVSADALAEKRRFLEETRIKYEVGRVAESEILRAELQFLQEQETNVLRRQSVIDRRERLLITLGLEPDNALSVLDVTEELARRPPVELPTVDESLAIARANRIELRQAQISVEFARISLSTARNDVLPNLDLTGGAQTQDQDRTGVGGATDLEDNTWDAGIQLRIPLPNIQRREALRRAELNLEKTRTNRVTTERSITLEVQNSHRSVSTAQRSLQILARTVEQARKNLELVNGSFEVGYSTITDVRLAQDDLFQAQSRYNNTLLNFQVAIANFYKALGQPLQ